MSEGEKEKKRKRKRKKTKNCGREVNDLGQERLCCRRSNSIWCLLLSNSATGCAANRLEPVRKLFAIYQRESNGDDLRTNSTASCRIRPLNAHCPCDIEHIQGQFPSVLGANRNFDVGTPLMTTDN